MIVMKFGGTSVGDAAAIRRAARIVLGAKEPVVVVSALSGVTDALAALGRLAVAGDPAISRELAALHARHAETAAGVAPPDGREILLAALRADFAALERLIHALSTIREVSPRAADALLAFGEIASSRIFTAALEAAGGRARWLDPRLLVVTDGAHGRAAPLMEATAGRLVPAVRSCVEAGVVPVLGGFVGATADGATTTLGRGGSDYSAAIAGACLDAREIQIWTDVDGMLSADPRVLAGPRLVPHLSFEEAAELAHFGAKVLHPATVRPAMLRGIPVRILNSGRPGGAGTVITAGAPERRAPLAAIACRRGLTLLEIRPRAGERHEAVVADALGTLARYAIGVDAIAMTDVGLSLAVPDHPEAAHACAALAARAEVAGRPGMALIAAVGDRLRVEPALSARLLEAIDGIRVVMVSRAAGGRSLVLIVPDEDLRPAIERLHGACFAPRRARRRPRGEPLTATVAAAAAAHGPRGGHAVAG